MKLTLILTTLTRLLLPTTAMATHVSPPFLTTDQISLAYTQTGPPSGPPLLFIPGWRQTAAEFRHQTTYFSSAGYRVTTYDLRGHGLSSSPPFGYRISRFAADLNDLLTFLDLHNVTIIGHSMGCSITWAWWDQYPSERNRVQGFVFVDQSAVMVRDPRWTDQEAEGLAAIFTPEAVYNLAANMATQLEPLVKSMFTPSVREEDLQWVLEENRKMSDGNAAVLLADHAFRDWRDVLGRIDVRTLVVAGEASVFPAKGVEWVAEQIKGAERVTFKREEEGSHFVFWENPEGFNAVVERFLRG